MHNQADLARDKAEVGQLISDVVASISRVSFQEIDTIIYRLQCKSRPSCSKCSATSPYSARRQLRLPDIPSEDVSYRCLYIYMYTYRYMSLGLRV